jgi:ABC-type transport system substrate-binding protein
MHKALGLLGILGFCLSLLGGGTEVTAQPTATQVVPKGKMTLAWHVGIAARWVDPQEHDGTATPDNFLTALHDALIKNSGTTLYDHPALAERYEFAQDAKSATFWLRKGIKFHNGEPVTYGSPIFKVVPEIWQPEQYTALPKSPTARESAVGQH